MIVTATVRPVGDLDAPVREVVVDRPDYEGALAVIRSELAEGEQLLFIMVDRG